MLLQSSCTLSNIVNRLGTNYIYLGLNNRYINLGVSLSDIFGAKRENIILQSYTLNLGRTSLHTPVQFFTDAVLCSE